eukprot:Sspe_Gene.43387::Locus_21149_Transcript_1_1_Confidence_1.000_Length_3727::g.43387::m.43387/K10357/MYO5; myosin V
MPPKQKEAFLDPEVGETCFFYNPNVHGWVCGTVLSWDGKTASCKAKPSDNKLFTWANGETVDKLKPEDVFMIKDETLLSENVEDLLSLTVLHDSTLLDVLRRRYMEDYIYTNIGAITVALNPFNFKIPWYTDDNMAKYLAEGDRIERNIPHSWATAHNTYWEMRNAISEPYNQCILVSGESGAGKTEASKIVMKYLAALSCKTGSEEQKQAGLAVGTKINITSPPLEAFGNARTVRNDNSSRFGKWMRVKFDDNGFLVGAHITKYLLEKSRIVTASLGERVYHSFYILCRSKDKAKWGITSDADYRNTSAGKQSDNKEFNTAEDFEEVCDSMRKLGVDETTINSVWKTVAGVMIMENIEFVSDGGEGSALAKGSETWVDKAVAVWEIDKATLQKELLTQTLHTAEGDVVKVLNPVNAMDGRSALTKTTYEHEFTWLIEACNAILNIESGGRWIGLLDIFGFEDFDLNSFEQLCINLANESLQNHYNKYIFEKDMDECRAEGIDVTSVEFPDNTPCLRMITDKKGGIFALLDEECLLGQGSDLSFLGKVEAACSSVEAYKPFFTKKTLAKTSFVIHHYAGSVSYEVEGFLEKNRDTLKPAFKEMMRASKDPFIAQILPAPDEDAKKMTVGGFFKTQVADLMELINSTNPHWIRCVKPHPAKKPLHFHGVLTMHQLASSGVLGTVKIRKAGFPVRIPFDVFYQKYRIVAAGQQMSPSDLRGAAQVIINAAGLETKMAQVGTSRTFLKSDAYVELEKKKKAALELHNAVVLAYARAYLAHHRIKESVYEKNKAIVEELRQKIKAQMAAEREKRKKEEEERKRAEQEAAEKIKADLERILHDQGIEEKGLLGEESRLWNQMMLDFERTAMQIEEEVIERQEREEREAREREERERLRLENAAIMIQKNVRGWLSREELLRELIERSRARVEFDSDARCFHQHMMMLQLDKDRLQVEAEYMVRTRLREANNQREAKWKAAEERRIQQAKAVEERKMAKYQQEALREEEISEQAIEEAQRLREERRRKQEEERLHREAANVKRKERMDRIAREAFQYRERKKKETLDYQQHREQQEIMTQLAFEEFVAAQQEARNAQSANKFNFDTGKRVWSEREQYELMRDQLLERGATSSQPHRAMEEALQRQAEDMDSPEYQYALSPIAARRAGRSGMPSAPGSPGWVPYQVDRYSR